MSAPPPVTEIDFFDYHAQVKAGTLAPGRYLVLLDPFTVHEHDDDPMYLDALAVLSATALQQAEEAARGRIRRCRNCKCTDARACPGGCYWVGRDLCSACLVDPNAAAGAAIMEKGFTFEN